MASDKLQEAERTRASAVQEAAYHRVKAADHIELGMDGSFGRLPPLVARPDSWDDYALDAESISWLSKRSMSAEVTMAIAGLVPEIVWDTGIAEIPLGRLYDTMRGYFDFSSRPPRSNP